jgi:hypothetical protein
MKNPPARGGFFVCTFFSLFADRSLDKTAKRCLLIPAARCCNSLPDFSEV